MQLRNSRFGKFYGCTGYPDCDGTHGAHPDGRPLGIPANKETKAARHLAHAAFDALWGERKLLSRGAAYRWLSLKLGHESHMGEMGIEDCERVIQLCEAFDPSDQAAVDARRESELKASAQKAKWKNQRKNWSAKKKADYNRKKKMRQKANRAARKIGANDGD
jgi:ssDNA-binding Zn-finger/Zn-ribbon topoisomerase 1